METVSNTPEITPRVQMGLDRIQRGRHQEKEVWNVPLTVLNEETKGMALVKRKALAIRKVLTEMPVRIEPHELIVGVSVQNSVGSLTPFPEYATPEEREKAAARYTGTYSVFGHFCPSYPKLLRLGLGALRREAEERLSARKRTGGAKEEEDWLEAVLISLGGLRDFMLRYAKRASDLSENGAEPARKEELIEIARIARTVSHEPPHSFREALQALWFAHVAFGSTMNFMSLGRFDQNLWPYLKRDLERRAITLEEAQELVDCLWLKFNDRLQSYELASRNVYVPSTPMTEMELAGTIAGIWGLYLGGNTTQDRLAPLQGSEFSTWLQTMPLSGLTPDGKDGTNPLTYLCIHATRRLKLPQPSLYVRLHDGSPAELYERTVDCIRNSNGPCIYNDEVIIPALAKQGLPIEHARDYTSDGCWETFVQGRTQFRYGIVSAPEALDRALFPGRWDEEAVPLKYVPELDPFRGSEIPDPNGFTTYDELWSSFTDQLSRYIRGMIETADNMMDGRLYDIAPLPLLSACTEGPLETGRDITKGGIEYAFYAPLLGGLSHAADSLAAIKKLCFDEKAIAWKELLEALKHNWEGKENLRQFVRTRAPAYGNDIDEVDHIAREIVAFYIGEVARHGAHAKNNARFHPGVGTFEHYVAMGSALPATPDGRLPGTPVASNASPTNGRARNGTTALINSYLKLPLGDLPTGAPLDIGMDTRSTHLLEPILRSFVEKRGNLLSISVNDVEKLKAAMREPEKYRDLKIRIGGWEAFFVDLPPAYQEWQIQKYEQHSG